MVKSKVTRDRLIMSGHSKWSTIKRQKGANDVKRGMTFTKIANAITIASRAGGSGDSDSNPRLRFVLEQARSVNMPKDNIQRAVDRGLGKLPGQTLDEVIYEGFGPGKVAFLVEGVTDNKLRTLQEVKNLFDRSGGSLGSKGSTAYMFEQIGEIKLKAKGGSSDDEILELIDLGVNDVEDFEEEGEKKYLVSVNGSELNTMSKNVTQLGYQLELAELVFRPTMLTQITNKEIETKVIDFAQRLEDHDDIQKVYANFEIESNS